MFFSRAFETYLLRPGLETNDGSPNPRAVFQQVRCNQGAPLSMPRPEGANRRGLRRGLRTPARAFVVVRLFMLFMSFCICLFGHLRMRARARARASARAHMTIKDYYALLLCIIIILSLISIS